MEILNESCAKVKVEKKKLKKNEKYEKNTMKSTSQRNRLN